MGKDETENSNQPSIGSGNSISWIRIVTSLATAVLAIVAVLWLVFYPIIWGIELELKVQRNEYHVISIEKSVKSLEESVKSLEESVKSLEESVKSLEEGQKEMMGRLDLLEKNIALLLRDRGLTPLTLQEQ